VTYGVLTAMQSVVRAVYPPQCALCNQLTEEDFALCPACWGATEFIAGTICDACGCQLPGDDGGVLLCDTCLADPRPWSRGRAALVYSGSGRKLVLALKYSDRTEIARTAAKFLRTKLGSLAVAKPLFVPVPLHYWRMIGRRYNQAALLAQALARLEGRAEAYVPDALVRNKPTTPLKGLDRDARFAALRGTISSHRRRGNALNGRNVILIDDVMTSGATLTAATSACYDAGAKTVCVLVLARAGKDA
jgi:ComF family protein